MILAICTYAAILIEACFSENAFSGFYVGPQDELYTASWLITRKRFLNSTNHIQNIGNLEGATFAILDYKCDNCGSVFTRDFLDFSVEHLSSTIMHIEDFNLHVISFTTYIIQFIVNVFIARDM